MESSDTVAIILLVVSRIRAWNSFTFVRGVGVLVGDLMVIIIEVVVVPGGCEKRFFHGKRREGASPNFPKHYYAKL